jgi:hypothetical protein
MKYSNNLSEAIQQEYEGTRINNPKYFGEWFITCKKDCTFFIAHYKAGETYRIHDKAYDIWGAVSYEISNSSLAWVKWDDLIKYFELNEEMQRFIIVQ